MQNDLVCETCNSSFQRREHYQRHLRTHTKEKPFTCSECKQSFSRVDSLARHHTALHLHGDRSDNAGRTDRRRVAQACKSCSISKVRCDGEHPCHRCAAQNYECYYEPSSKRRAADQGLDKHTSKRQKTAHGPPISPPQTVCESSSSHDTILVDAGMPRSTPSSFHQHTPPGRLPEIVGPPQTDLTPLYTASSVGLNERDAFPADLRLGLMEMVGDFDPSRSTMTPSLPFSDMLDAEVWGGGDFEMDLFSYLRQPATIAFDDNWLETETVAKEVSAPAPGTVCIPSSPSTGIMDQSAVDELYNRSHSPALDQDAVEPREYHPTSIEVDAQLVFPDMSQLGADDVDHEDLAHVDEVSPKLAEEVSQFASYVQSGLHFPRFIELRIPPSPVLNAWVQLYFEHFHPVFPILHKPSFSSKKRHWLLVFAVAAIGSHFSGIKDAQHCGRAMHELIRRQSSTMCEQRNQYGREFFMLQTLILNHVGMMYSGERRALEVAEFLQALPITLARRKRLFTNMFPSRSISELPLPLSQKWQIWVLNEERGRAAFATWLIDCAFGYHFELTNLMAPSELKIVLPQTEERWCASSAQSWASFPSGTDASRTFTLEQVVSASGWKAAWAKTNTLGKQVMLQYLANIVHERPNSPVADTLAALLALAEDETAEGSIAELKGTVVHQILALAALMIHNCPTRDFTTMAVRCLYGKMEEEEWAHLAEKWRAAAGQGRLACFYAARVLHAVRTNHCTHFATPVSLLRAVLVLWVYSSLAERFGEGFVFPYPAPVVVLGPKPLLAMETTEWIEAGWGRVKLPGIGNLLYSGGRCRLLDESVALMRSLKAWGISITYSQLLLRLRSSERLPSEEKL